MFTRNFMKCMCTKLFALSSNNITGINSIGASTSAFYSNSDKKWSTINSGSDLNADVNTQLSNNDGSFRFMVRFGKGTTSPTVDDYDLEDIISTSDLSILQQLANEQLMQDEQIIEVASIINNTTKSDILINEVGVYSRLYANTQGNGYPYLLWREVLDTPIVAKANKDCKITVRLDFSKING